MAKRAKKPDKASKDKDKGKTAPPIEKGGVAGPEPTRYGDWERGGRCTDF